MGEKMSVKDLDLKGKKALIRVDFNVPIENGRITDDTRIRASIPTIQYVLDQGASVILMSHLGRPKGRPEAQFSLAPCAKRLSELINKSVQMASDCIGPEVQEKAKNLQPGQLLLLENLRFHPGEEEPAAEPSFADSLAELGDVYIDDAFGCAHRDHASITTIAQFFPNKAAAGFLLQKEMTFLGEAFRNPKRPFCAILGGAKISTKFKVIESLMQKADVLLIGGAMAYTFFKSEQIPIGTSLCEEDFINVAREIIDVSTQGRCKIFLPVDIVVANRIGPDAEIRVVDMKEGIPAGFQGVDIGPKTVKLFSEEIKKASTIFWNGPLGIFEKPPFDKGTNAIAKVLADHKGMTIVGGGDSAAAVERAGFAKQMSHISTGGGASLEYIELGTLPGIDALSDKNV